MMHASAFRVSTTLTGLSQTRGVQGAADQDAWCSRLRMLGARGRVLQTSSERSSNTGTPAQAYSANGRSSLLPKSPLA